MHHDVRSRCRAPRGARGLKRDDAGIERQSRPARGAWIETCSRDAGMPSDRVAPRAGRVD